MKREQTYQTKSPNVKNKGLTSVPTGGKQNRNEVVRHMKSDSQTSVAAAGLVNSYGAAIPGQAHLRHGKNQTESSQAQMVQVNQAQSHRHSMQASSAITKQKAALKQLQKQTKAELASGNNDIQHLTAQMANSRDAIASQSFGMVSSNPSFQPGSQGYQKMMQHKKMISQTTDNTPPPKQASSKARMLTGENQMIEAIHQSITQLPSGENTHHGFNNQNFHSMQQHHHKRA